MKILLPVDGSPCSNEAIEEVTRRCWPASSEIKVLYVVHVAIPDWPDPLLQLYAARGDMLATEQKHAQASIDKVISLLKSSENTSQLEITGEILEGSPKKLIVEEAAKWGADLIVLGSHGRGAIGRAFLGSVSLAVISHAKCSVEIVRSKH